MMQTLCTTRPPSISMSSIGATSAISNAFSTPLPPACTPPTTKKIPTTQNARRTPPTRRRRTASTVGKSFFQKGSSSRTIAITVCETVLPATTISLDRRAPGPAGKKKPQQQFVVKSPLLQTMGKLRFGVMDAKLVRFFTLMSALRARRALCARLSRDRSTWVRTRLVTINQLVDLVCGIAGKSLHKKHTSGPMGVRGRNSDNTLIEKKLGWRPSQSLRGGLERTYAWIEKQVRRNAPLQVA